MSVAVSLLGLASLTAISVAVATRVGKQLYRDYQEIVAAAAPDVPLDRDTSKVLYHWLFSQLAQHREVSMSKTKLRDRIQTVQEPPAGEKKAQEPEGFWSSIDRGNPRLAITYKDKRTQYEEELYLPVPKSLAENYYGLAYAWLVNWLVHGHIAISTSATEDELYLEFKEAQGIPCELERGFYTLLQELCGESQVSITKFTGVMNSKSAVIWQYIAKMQRECSKQANARDLVYSKREAPWRRRYCLTTKGKQSLSSLFSVGMFADTYLKKHPSAREWSDLLGYCIILGVDDVVLPTFLAAYPKAFASIEGATSCENLSLQLLMAKRFARVLCQYILAERAKTLAGSASGGPL